MTAVEKSDCLVKLLEALERGWKIDEPVLFGVMWATDAKTTPVVYHFVLRNKSKGKTTLLSLPTSPELCAFLAEKNIRVNSL